MKTRQILPIAVALALATVTVSAQQAAPAPAAPMAPSAAAPVAGAPGMPGMPTSAAPQTSVRPLALPSGDAAFLAREQELNRQLRLAELEAKIAEARRKAQEASAPRPPALDSVTGLPPLGALPGVSPAPASLGMPPMPALSAIAAPPRPAPPPLPFTLMSVWGAENAYQADIAANGLRVTVREGDMLPGGWKVANVGRTGIIVRKGKQSKMLRVGG